MTNQKKKEIVQDDSQDTLDESSTKTRSNKQLRWLKFVELYMTTGNATESYKGAGFSSTSEGAIRASASRLLKNPWIQVEIEKRYNDMVEGRNPTLPPEEDLKMLVCSREEIHRQLTSIIRDEFSTYSERLKAIDQLSKLYGMYETKIEVKAPSNIAKALRSTLGIDEDEDDDEYVD